MQIAECPRMAVTVTPVDRLDHSVHSGPRRGMWSGLSPASLGILRGLIATCAVLLAHAGAGQEARLSASQGSAKAAVASLEDAEQPEARPVSAASVDRRIAQAFALFDLRPDLDRGLVAIDVEDSPIFSLRIARSEPHAEGENSSTPVIAPRYAASDPRLPFTYILRESQGVLDSPDTSIADHVTAFAPPEELRSGAISPFADAPRLSTGTALPVPTGRPNRDSSRTAAKSPESARATPPASVAPTARKTKGPAGPVERPRDLKAQSRQANVIRSAAPAVAEPAARRRETQPAAAVRSAPKLPDSLLPTRPAAD